MKKSFLLTLILLFSLTGCSDKNDSTTASPLDATETSTSSDAVATSTDGSLADYNSIADSDWNIKNYPFANGTNIYEISPTLHHDYGRITDMEIIDDCYYIVYGDWQDNFCLYKIDPINVNVHSEVTLDDGTYNDDCLVTTDDGLVVLNSDTNTLYTYDSDLNNIATNTLDNVTTTKIFVTSNYAYYYDTSRQGLFQYDIATETENQLFQDINLAFKEFVVDGILGNDEYILYSYKDSNNVSTYEIRNIATGECAYNGNNLITYENSINDSFVINYELDDVTYTLTGTTKDSDPYVLYTNTFYSELYSSTDVSDTLLLSSKTEPTEDDDTVIMHIDLCDKTSGETLNSMTLTLEGDNAREYQLDNAVLLDDKYVIFSMCDLSTKMLIWDITTDNNEVSDNKLFKWHNTYEIDENFATMLDEKASALEDKYHISIHYGDDASAYSPGGYSIQPLYNGLLTNMTLDTFDTALSVYPDGMLAQLDSEYTSEINYVLTADISGYDMAYYGGLQYYSSGKTCAALRINGSVLLVNNIYHETFHAIEQYMTNKSSYACFSDWNQYNPEGFSYYNSYAYFDSATYETESYKYTPGDPYGQEVYFTQSYSKVNALEDRAKIMETAMNPEHYDYGYLTNEPLQNKLRCISEEIRKYFDTTGWPETTIWEEPLL